MNVTDVVTDSKKTNQHQTPSEQSEYGLFGKNINEY